MKTRTVTILAVTLWLALIVTGAASCTDQDEARRVLDDEGYTDVRFTGYAFAACSKDDTSHTGFVAKNAKGKEVEGVVCCGLLFKACTVRH